MPESKATISGAVIGFVTASISLAIAFGVHLTPVEQNAILAEATAVLAIAPAIGALIDHSKRLAQAHVTAATIAAQK